jgi:hypothetical protein
MSNAYSHYLAQRRRIDAAANARIKQQAFDRQRMMAQLHAAGFSQQQARTLLNLFGGK